MKTNKNIIGNFKLEIAFWIMFIWLFSFFNGFLAGINKINILKDLTKDDSIFLTLSYFINTTTTAIFAIIAIGRILFVISDKFDLKNKYKNEEDYYI